MVNLLIGKGLRVARAEFGSQSWFVTHNGATIAMCGTEFEAHEVARTLAALQAAYDDAGDLGSSRQVAHV